jgi:hypothetical protein
VVVQVVLRGTVTLTSIVVAMSYANFPFFFRLRFANITGDGSDMHVPVAESNSPSRLCVNAIVPNQVSSLGACSRDHMYNLRSQPHQHSSIPPPPPPPHTHIHIHIHIHTHRHPTHTRTHTHTHAHSLTHTHSRTLTYTYTHTYTHTHTRTHTHTHTHSLTSTQK